jgi:maleylacetoacetate isomerase
MNSNIEKKYFNFVLYSYWRSSCSWRVRIVMNMKNINYEIKPVHLVKGEQKSEEFEKLNPTKRVPLLQFHLGEKENVISIPESSAICEFLEETFPEIPLLPSDPIARAKVRAICCEIACNIQPIQNLSVINRIQEIGGNKMDWAKEWISKGLDEVEKLLIQTRGKYSYGDEVTMADAFLIPQLYNARRFAVEMNNYSNILEIEKNLSSIEAFKLAAPESQPDFEPNK